MHDPINRKRGIEMPKTAVKAKYTQAQIDNWAKMDEAAEAFRVEWESMPLKFRQDVESLLRRHMGAGYTRMCRIILGR